MKKVKLSFLVFGVLLLSNVSKGQNATEIIKKADQLMQGESNYSEMTMTIVRPKWTRTMAFKTCSKGVDYSMTLITTPAKEAGQSFLKRKREMWSWSPQINRMVKLPPAMLSQGWMGSDFSNDELLNESSIVVDYTHKILGSEVIAGKDCWKIELTPLSSSSVVWGKLLKWVSKDGYLQLKTQYFDQDNYLVKTENASKIKTMNGREIPTYFELIPEEEKGNKTIVEMQNIIFNISVDENFFSQQNLKKGTAIQFPKK